MTYEEAKELFEGLEVQVPIGCSRDFRVAREKVIEALEKQIPKKPTFESSATTVCAECDTCIFLSDKFCPRCGQAIDWSE